MCAAIRPPGPDPLVHIGRLWGLRLGVGIFFSIYGLLVLSYQARSLSLTAIFMGVAFLLGAVSLLVTAAAVEELRWVWVIGGLVALAAGIVAFAYPGETLRALGLLLGWFLLVAGVIDVVLSFTGRDVEWWWLRLARGAILFGLGAWAAGEPDKSVLLLVTIVGVYCLFNGITEIILALQLRNRGTS
jgi:uncharacterized membrane protein HdeD (DUF308 family)